MKAKAIFKKLGYEVYRNYKFKTDNDLIAYTNGGVYIYFYKNKIVEFRCDYAVGYKVFEAINQQCRELGWLDEA